MKVIIDDAVRNHLKQFYADAIQRHPTLDEVVVQQKVDRLFDALGKLGQFPNKYPLARYRANWLKQKYHDFVFEDLHAAYKVISLDGTEKVVYVADVCHSLEYHD